MNLSNPVNEAFSQGLVLKLLLPRRHDVLVDLLYLWQKTHKKPTAQSLQRTAGGLGLKHTHDENVKNLLGFLDSVSEKRGLMLAVVVEDVEGLLSANQAIDGWLHHVVEVSGWKRIVQHVAHLRMDTPTTQRKV